MASQPPRPVVMDPLHITEFASDRYFSKLQQQQQQQQQLNVSQPHSEEPSSTSAAVLTSHPVYFTSLPTQSPFILPLRESKPLPAAQLAPDDREPLAEHRQKRSRFNFGKRLHPKLPIPLHINAQIPLPISVSVEPSLSEPRLALPGFAAPKPVRSFGTLFLILPTELQIQIISSMPLADILKLRLASKAWHAMITAIESPIVRYHLQHNIPTYAKRLYPPDYTNLNLAYLCGLWHRLHVSAKLSALICEWVTKEIFLRTTEMQRLEFAPQRERMRRRLIPLLFTIFHFFEQYRIRHLQYIINHGGKGLKHTPYTVNPIEAEIMNMYDDRTLLGVHQVFPLVVASFCRRLRPPSYVGRVEKSLRGYLKDKPPDVVHVATLCIGGMRQVERFWEIKGYNTRRNAVDVWYNSVTRDACEPTVKQRRGLMMGLGRKRSVVAMRDEVTSTIIPAASKVPTEEPIIESRMSLDEPNGDQHSNLVFNTSLAYGMPMGPLPREHLRLLLPDLPVLQHIWLVTAESLILERKIVKKPADIMRNAQVMLDLIRDDGIAEEDEWWYGQGPHDSIRPPLDVIEEDTIEETHL